MENMTVNMHFWGLPQNALRRERRQQRRDPCGAPFPFDADHGNCTVGILGERQRL